MKKFDINTHELFITYPKKRQAKEILDDFVSQPYVCSVIVGTETYKSGKEHYHVFVRTIVKVKWTGPLLDTIGGIHGHYMRVKETPKKVIAYIVKDNNYICTQQTQEEINESIQTYAYSSPHYKQAELRRRWKEEDKNWKPRNFQHKTKQGKPNK